MIYQKTGPALSQLVQFVLSKFKNCSYSTINSYLSGISFLLKINNLHDPTRAFIIQKMLCGLRRLRPTKDTRMPIIMTVLKQIQSALSSVASSHFEADLVSTMYIITYFGFLRVSEIAVERKNGDNNKVVEFSNAKLTVSQCELIIPILNHGLLIDRILSHLLIEK